MELSRNTGLAIGLGIGFVIAGSIFGVTRFFQGREEAALTRAQAFPPPASASPAEVETLTRATTASPGDSLVNRLPSDKELLEGIRKNLTEISVSESGTPERR